LQSIEKYLANIWHVFGHLQSIELKYEHLAINQTVMAASFRLSVIAVQKESKHGTASSDTFLLHPSAR
jgi:hypothetical protein